MGFVTIDLIFLAVFSLAAVIFLYTRKHNLERQGILYLYKTQLGIKFIDKFAKKFATILRPMQYLVLLSGYMLMGVIVWLIVKTTHIYLTTQISQVVSTPPIAPLIPYFPKIFGLESFFPPLYFTYFIIALALVAVCHEFAHGIFARLHGFKIQSTGFAFMGPFLGAFVEPDEKEMSKAKKFPQLAVLGAGTFANVLVAVIFGVIMWLFFTGLFVPAGVLVDPSPVKFNVFSPTYQPIKIADITLEDDIIIYEKFIRVEANGKTFYVNKDVLKQSRDNDFEQIIAYDDTPAFRKQLKGAITEIGGKDVNDLDDLSAALDSFKPGDIVNVKLAVLVTGQGVVYELREEEIVLGDRDGKAALGVWQLTGDDKGLINSVLKLFEKMKNPSLHYETNLGDIGWFIYYLLWWIVVINILVALFNMLPLGILDGGRFFYLTIWGITGKEKLGKKAYSIITWALLAMLALMMVKWVFRFF